MKTNKEAKRLLADIMGPLKVGIHNEKRNNTYDPARSIPDRCAAVLHVFAMDLGLFRTEDAFYRWYDSI